eukprot:TRINITY_DN7013_c0_g1_i1.p1 TRINITY_DN7013_c0_g1~~TRINITY_DN7013_c0_g1_i1.p1  ORF type:complete len:141 (-),score=31.68 TRINITY_DN7013_c0_g1_i1:479-901(-)
MATGVAISDDAVEQFNSLKLRKTSRYVLYRINDTATEVLTEEVAPSSATWADFVAKLPANDCRYGVFDFEFTTADGGIRNKIMFIVWAPDTAKIKSKMLYAGSKDAFRKKLVGIALEVQATDSSEIDYQVIFDKASSNTR